MHEYGLQTCEQYLGLRFIQDVIVLINGNRFAYDVLVLTAENYVTQGLILNFVQKHLERNTSFQ